MPVNHKMQGWIDAAGHREVLALATAAGITASYIYQIARGDRVASSDVAGRLSSGANIINQLRGGGLPELCRTDLSPTCAACAFAMQCKKNDRKG